MGIKNVVLDVDFESVEVAKNSCEKKLSTKKGQKNGVFDLTFLGELFAFSSNGLQLNIKFSSFYDTHIKFL
jgi:hypothetical protein